MVSAINWTIVSQLSRQQLQWSTVSLSRWPSNSVYSTMHMSQQSVHCTSLSAAVDTFLTGHTPNLQCQSTDGVGTNSVLFCSLAVLDPRAGHTTDVLSPFISVLSHSDRLFHGESCPHLDVVHPGRAQSSSTACNWHCSLHYLFLQATPLLPQWWCDHTVC